jgi:hypothetical protein
MSFFTVVIATRNRPGPARFGMRSNLFSFSPSRTSRSSSSTMAPQAISVQICFDPQGRWIEHTLLRPHPPTHDGRVDLGRLSSALHESP